MHNDDNQDAIDAGLGSGSLADRRAALIRLLVASAGAYTIPLVASFSMGGLSVKAQTFGKPGGSNQPPPGGNQCVAGNMTGGNQPYPLGVYRIGLDARYKLDGVGPRGHVPIALLVQLDLASIVYDEDGWSSRARVDFYSQGPGLVTVTSPFTVIVSKLSSTFTLLPIQFETGKPTAPEIPGDGAIRGGGPLTLLSPKLGGLKPSADYKVPIINRIRVVFSATMDAQTARCGMLSIISIKSPATLQVAAATRLGTVPSGELSPGTVRSGALP